jgi:cytochrome c oxidase assembly protein subunit 15
MADLTRKERVVRTATNVVAVGVFLLLIAGALVTSTESGLAVPDWPLSYGKLMPPMVGGIRFEHGHRLVAAFVSALVGLEVALLLLFEKRKWVRSLGFAAFGAILLQALLGGLTVKLLLPPAVSSGHALLAEIVFALAAAIALATSRGYEDGSLFAASPADVPKLESALSASRLAAGAILVQILLGAVMRHTAAGLAVPDFPLAFGRLLPGAADLARPGVAIHLAHRLGALAVTVLVIRAAARLARLAHVSTLFERLAACWLAALAAQLVLGPLSIWSRKAPAVTVAHLGFGALCWVAGVLSCVALARARGLAVSQERRGPSSAAPEPPEPADVEAPVLEAMSAGSAA